ncbi:MAG: endonuclease III [Chloroflexi bacterium]|nr:endonuclease III [Chloroflexota bacterium]
MDVSNINRLLARQYGVREWHQHHDPLSELIATILSQNTSDTNSGRAFTSLREKFPNWEEVAKANVNAIEKAIRSGGLSHIKAARIKEILQTILKERGSLDLSFLDNIPLGESKAWLRQLPGVGPKTVGCVLLFSLGKPVFPVDTHVFRVSKRLGLIANGISAEQAHELLAGMVPVEHVYEFHMNMVDHGRKTCKSQRPKCPNCVLREACPSSYQIS